MRYATFISVFILVVISSTLIGQTQISKVIYFDFDDDKIGAESESELLKFKMELASYTESHLKIVGHTDQDGSDDYNMQLSQKRAESVKRFITSNQFPSADISVNYLGESDLVLLSSDAKAKEKNRRVTVIAEVYDYKTAAEMVNQLVANNDEVKRVNQKSESILKLRKGTEVKIPENAFCHADGSPIVGDNVDIKFKEAFDFAAMVDESLFTQTKDQLLETGGMIYIAASQNGKELKLNDGKQIELLFPKQEFKDGMELFTGVNDENGIIWDETGEEITSIKDEFFIQVDMSAMFDVPLEAHDTLGLNLAPMPKYPHPKRIAYPPAKNKYTEERYKEVYKMYEDVMAAHYKDEEDRPERLKKWNDEVSRRKKILYNHKKECIRAKLTNQLDAALSRVNEKQYNISNDKLVGSLLAFLEKDAWQVGYNEAYYRNRIFKGSIREVLKYNEIRFPNFKQFSIQAFFPEFHAVLKTVQKEIMIEKYIMGYVDEGNTEDSAIFASYIVKTSNLGWINCDRFFNIPENEKLNLEVAEFAEGQHYYLVFKNIKSLIRPETVQNKIVFVNIPKGEDVKIIGLSFKNNSAYVATQDLTIGSGDAIALSYEKKGIKELREEFKEI